METDPTVRVDGALTSSFHLFGGFCPKTSRFHSDLWKYKEEDEMWELVQNGKDSPCPLPRVGAFAVDIQDGILVGMGTGEKGWLNDVWLYRENSWKAIEFIGPCPCPRTSMGYTWSPQGLWIHGGACKTSGALNDLWLLDTTSFQWTSFPVDGQVPALADHTLHWTSIGLVALGGQGKDGHLQETKGDMPVYVLDLTISRWFLWPIVGKGILPRTRHSSCVIHQGNAIFQSGGMHSVSQWLDEAWVLDLGARRWRRVEYTMEDRRDHCCGVALDGSVVVVGGRCKERTQPIRILHFPSHVLPPLGKALHDPLDRSVPGQLFAFGKNQWKRDMNCAHITIHKVTMRHGRTAVLDGVSGKVWMWEQGETPLMVPALRDMHCVSFAMSNEWLGAVNHQGEMIVIDANGSRLRTWMLEGMRAVSVAGGGEHLVFLTTGGAAFAYGSNSHGQLGNDSDEGVFELPVQVSGTGNGAQHTRFVQIACGNHHSAAIDTAGRVWAWGDPAYVGGRDEKRQPSGRIPWRISALATESCILVTCGARHTVALAQGGSTVFAWGDQDGGILGSNTLPQAVPALTGMGIRSIAIGDLSMCAVVTEDHLHLWQDKEHHTQEMSSNVQGIAVGESSVCCWTTPPQSRVDPTTRHADQALLGSLFGMLPNDAIRLVLSELSPVDLARMQQTCRTMSVLARDDRLWCKHYKKDVLDERDGVFMPGITGSALLLKKHVVPAFGWHSVYSAWFNHIYREKEKRRQAAEETTRELLRQQRRETMMHTLEVIASGPKKLLRLMLSPFRGPTVNTCIIGLDAAGKTTLMHHFRKGEVEWLIPTIGFNMEVITRDDGMTWCWDIGGGGRIWPLFRHFFQATDVMVIMVDCNDIERLPELRDQLQRRIYEAEYLERASFLLVCNKQDLPGALPANEVAERLGFTEAFRNTERRWNVMEIALVGEERFAHANDIWKWIHQS